MYLQLVTYDDDDDDAELGVIDDVLMELLKLNESNKILSIREIHQQIN